MGRDLKKQKKADRTGYDYNNGTPPYIIATTEEEGETKKKKKNQKDMRRIRRENAKKYKSDASSILYTDAKILDVIDMITIVP